MRVVFVGVIAAHESWRANMNCQSPDVGLASSGHITSKVNPVNGDVVWRAKIARIFRRIAPYLSVLAALVLVVLVLVSMHFTSLDWQWVTFFGGVLSAAVVTLGTRSLGAERLAARRGTQLALAHQQLARETALRCRAKQELAAIENDIAFLHESLPVMIAYVDTQLQLKYYNRAFHNGLGAAIGNIDGRHLRDVLSGVVYVELESDISNAFGGRVVHRDQMYKSTAGQNVLLKMQFLPKFAADGTVSGVFLLATEMTGLEVVAAPVNVAPRLALQGAESLPPSPDGAVERDADASRLRFALANDEFCLFYQTIEPVDKRGAAVPFREILLRLKLEEESMMPPGSFLPVAEEYGMMPDLDRWVTRQLLGWIRIDPIRRHAAYSVNMSAQTMADVEFPAFVGQALRDFGLPGSLLCFELQESDLLHWSEDAIRTISRLQPEGCRFAICGFRGNRDSFDLLQRVPVNFLKIDGCLILNIQRSAIDMARVKSIQRVARAIGVSTIAECVEDDITLAQLRTLGVDFAQGFGISRPQDLRQIALSIPPDTTDESAARLSTTPMAAE